MFTAVDGETMKVAWQIMVDGNLDNVDADYQGKYAWSTCYNSEEGVTLAEMMAKEQDWVVIFNLKRIEEAVEGREGRDDQRRAGPRRPPWFAPSPATSRSATARTASTPRRTASTSSPTASCRRLSRSSTPASSTTCSTTRSSRATWSSPSRSSASARCIPPMTARATPSRRFSSTARSCKWNIDLAKRAFKGEKVNPVIQKLDVHYQPGHNHTSMGQTKEADGKWLISLNKFSKDRFLNVGPLKPENDQLIDISGDQMVLVHDGPSFAEPHDATIVHRSKINPLHVWKRDDPFFADAVQQAKADGVDLMADSKVIRDGSKVRVYMTSAAPAFGLESFQVKQGDEVTVYVTNIDDVEDLTHGFCIVNYGINMEVAPQATASVTFTASKPGVYWYYCSWFCHAMHMEMQGRMFVEPQAT